MMGELGKPIDLEMMMMHQWTGQALPHAGLLEQRVLELESLGMSDAEEMPGVPSTVRQYAIASLQHTKPAYFITYDDLLLAHREELETRYGLAILSVYEAMLLLRDNDTPPD
jgi:hypothetical protein